MQIQKSFEDQDAGKLYLVGTPIGNLEDMTFRAVNILKEVDEIAAEDTRRTRKLLNRFEIAKPVASYHEHNKHVSGPRILQKLEQGRSIALVSDAGMPAVSDPGNDLVAAAVEKNIPVIPVPGANAALASLIVSGLDTSRFSFAGFLPRDNKSKGQALEQWGRRPETLLFYEAPHRVEKTLQAMLQAWGDRKIALSRELTKTHEEIVRGTIRECLEWLKDHPPRGEYCLVVEGAPEREERPDAGWWASLSVEEHVEHYIRDGDERKTAMKKAAADRGISKRDVYRELHLNNR